MDSLKQVATMLKTDDLFVHAYVKVLGKLGASLRSFTTYFSVAYFIFRQPEWVQQNMLQCLPEFAEFYAKPTQASYIDALQFASS